MNLSTGQISFAILFVLGFVAAMIWAYRKDLANQPIYFKGSLYVLIGIITMFIAFRFLPVLIK